ncbi:TonB-dependent siderophore receptor [Ottowia sp. VDI28]|uniref:TonB-dependent siderophore receptor n=1 Tax=Ottowia sp. VDI28 TaxID=3133968 RepID=UPI003C2F5589
MQVQATSEAGAPGLDLGLRRSVNSGALGQRSALETPFSSTSISSEAIEQAAPTKQADLFFTDASVLATGSTSGGWASYTQVRGLELDWQNSYRIDGHPFNSYSTVMPFEQFDQVDLLKGATGFLYGFGSPGGLINYVTKKPPAAGSEPVRNVSIGYASGSVWRGSADVGGRFGGDERFGYRLNATHEEGKAADKSSLRRDAISLALDGRITPDLTWDMQAIYQRRKSWDITPSLYLGSYTGSVLPATIPNNNGYLTGPGTVSDNEFKYVSTGLKYQLAPDWQLSASYSHSGTRTHRAESVLWLSDPAGNYDNYRSDYGESYLFNQVEAMLQGKVQTGSIGHQIVAGISRQESHNDYTPYNYPYAGPGSLYQPNLYANHSPWGLSDMPLYRSASATQQALFASDTLTFSPQWSLLAGLRTTRYEQLQFGESGGQTSRYSKSGVLTPTLALMYKLAPEIMLYASYVEALEPGTIVGDPTLTNYGQMLNPIKSRQYEVGVKTQQRGWEAAAALFRIEKTSEYSNGETMLQNGRSIYQGLELSAAAHLGKQWRIGGSLMALDATYGQGDSSINGHRIAGTARMIASAQVGYRVPQVPGLQLFAGLKYTGNTMLNAQNSIQVPSYTLIGLGASYDTVVAGNSTTLRVQVNNAANKQYWGYQYAGYIKPGDSRSISMTATMRF